MLFIFYELRTATAAATSDKLGEILVREGLITPEQLKRALQEQKGSGMRLGYTLVKLGFVEETEVSKMLARQYRMPAVDLSRFEVDPKILKLIPPDIATKHTVLPLKREGRTLTVAIADPNNVTAIEDIKFITRCDVFPVIAGEYTLRNAIDKYYQQSDAQLQTLLKDIEAADDLEVVEEQTDEDVKAQDLADDAPVVKLINGLLTDAVKRGASDIHIEPFEHEMRVRYRVDGALHEVMKPPIKMRAALTSRIKIMAQLNIAERRVPQDGRIKLKFGAKVIDYRVSTLPVLFGEDRAPDSRQGQPDARSDQVRIRAQGRTGVVAGDPESLRHGAGDGSHRVGQDHDPVFGAVAHQPDRREHHDRRGSGRVQLDGNQSGPGAQRCGDDLRGGVEGVPAAGSEHHHGGRDPRSRDRLDRDQGGSHGSPGAVHAAHQRRAVHRDPHDRHGDRAVQRGECGQPDRGAAIGAPRVLRVQAGAHLHSRGDPRVRHRPRRSREADLLQGRGLRHVRRLGVQGPAGAVRGHGHDQRGATHGAEGRIDRGAAGAGGEGRHAHAPHGRHAQGEARHHHPGGSREGDSGMTAGASQTVNLRGACGHAAVS